MTKKNIMKRKPITKETITDDGTEMANIWMIEQSVTHREDGPAVEANGVGMHFLFDSYIEEELYHSIVGKSSIETAKNFLAALELGLFRPMLRGHYHLKETTEEIVEAVMTKYFGENTASHVKTTAKFGLIGHQIRSIELQPQKQKFIDALARLKPTTKSYRRKKVQSTTKKPL